jgi:hypothetical protein
MVAEHSMQDHLTGLPEGKESQELLDRDSQTSDPVDHR